MQKFNQITFCKWKPKPAPTIPHVCFCHFNSAFHFTQQTNLASPHANLLQSFQEKVFAYKTKIKPSRGVLPNYANYFWRIPLEMGISPTIHLKWFAELNLNPTEICWSTQFYRFTKYYELTLMYYDILQNIFGYFEYLCTIIKTYENHQQPN